MTESNDAQQLADAVQRLRIAYEQYFAGVERMEPVKERDRVKKDLRRLMSVRSNNTAFKFKLQTTQATLITYEAHWDRIVRQIEEGTFKRDKLKAQRHLEAMKDMSSEAELIEDVQPATDSRQPTADSRQPATDSRQPTADNRRPTADNRQPTADNRQPTADSRRPTTDSRQPTTAPQAQQSTAAADPIRKLHEAFLAARVQTGESKPVSFEALAETIRKQTAAVKSQMGCERVEFRVAIKDGKAVLKAIPR